MNNMQGLFLQITMYGSEKGELGEPRPFKIFSEVKKRTPISDYVCAAWLINQVSSCGCHIGMFFDAWHF